MHDKDKVFISSSAFGFGFCGVDFYDVTAVPKHQNVKAIEKKCILPSIVIRTSMRQGLLIFFINHNLF